MVPRLEECFPWANVLFYQVVPIYGLSVAVWPTARHWPDLQSHMSSHECSSISEHSWNWWWRRWTHWKRARCWEHQDFQDTFPSPFRQFGLHWYGIAVGFKLSKHELHSREPRLAASPEENEGEIEFQQIQAITCKFYYAIKYRYLSFVLSHTSVYVLRCSR